jgi:hypothetical protein
MLGRGIILLALLLWGGVTASLLLRTNSASGGAHAETPFAAPAHTSSEAVINKDWTGLPFRSIGMELQRVDWMDTEYVKSIDEIAALGFDTVLFVVDPRQENTESNKIYMDLRMTPGPEALQRLIRHAKSRGLRVALMPIVLLDAPRSDAEWRGNIKPQSWSVWWASYREMVTHYGWIAEGTGVDLFIVGSELISTESNTAEWRKVISTVREVYHGRITYSSNWDHYTAIKYWDDLDLIGINAYWSLDRGKKEDCTLGDINTAWRDIQADLLPFAAKQHKPIMMVEAGWCSLANAANEPWDYTQKHLSRDPDLQKRLYEGFLDTWYGHPQLGGFSIWEWMVEDPDEKGYTPKGKPAEKVLREYLGRPIWKIDANRVSNFSDNSQGGNRVGSR